MMCVICMYMYRIYPFQEGYKARYIPQGRAVLEWSQGSAKGEARGTSPMKLELSACVPMNSISRSTYCGFLCVGTLLVKFHNLKQTWGLNHWCTWVSWCSLVVEVWCGLKFNNIHSYKCCEMLLTHFCRISLLAGTYLIYTMFRLFWPGAYLVAANRTKAAHFLSFGYHKILQIVMQDQAAIWCWRPSQALSCTVQTGFTHAGISDTSSPANMQSWIAQA